MVDNDSQDESLEYLRKVKWIKLEARTFGDEKVLGSDAEGSGLNIGLEQCNSEFYVVMHSDTIVKKDGWLTELIKHFDAGENVTCVGSGKIESKPLFLRITKKLTDFQSLKRKLFYNPKLHEQYRYHNRTICCLYRTEVLRRENLSFLMGKERSLTAGQGLYLEMLKRGIKTVELPTSVMGRYVVHLNHATMVLNQDEFTLRRKTVKKYKHAVDEVMFSDIFQSILNDESLDQ